MADWRLFVPVTHHPSRTESTQQQLPVPWITRIIFRPLELNVESTVNPRDFLFHVSSAACSLPTSFVAVGHAPTETTHSSSAEHEDKTRAFNKSLKHNFFGVINVAEKKSEEETERKFQV